MLIDCHIHCALSGLGRLKKGEIADSDKRRSWFEMLIKHYKRFGVIALRDGGDAWGSGVEFRKMTADAGIVFKTPILALHKKNQYGDFLGQAISDLGNGLSKMKELIKRQPDFIKIIQSGIMSFETFGQSGPLGFTKEELTFLINRGKDAGLKTMVHVNTAEGILMAIEAGADSIEHGYGIDDNAILALKESGSTWVPTLAPFANIAACDAAHPFAKYRQVSQKYFDKHREQVKKAHKMGVVIALGSDAGASLVPHGQGTKDELAYLKSCGMEETLILKNSARIIGVEINKK